jgi:hypothetical protein
MWHDEDWETFCFLLEEAWPGDFDDRTRGAWRLLIADQPPETIIPALKALMAEGHRFRPSVSELLAATRRDPSKPTFDEAYRLIYGAGGVLRAEPSHDAFDGPVTYRSERERRAMFDQAARDRAAGMHPLIASFVERHGLDRLRELPVDDPEWGGKHRRDLEKAWDRHVETSDGRDIAALAAGPRRNGLRRLDPLEALNLPRPVPQLVTSTTPNGGPDA